MDSRLIYRMPIWHLISCEEFCTYLEHIGPDYYELRTGILKHIWQPEITFAFFLTIVLWFWALSTLNLLQLTKPIPTNTHMIVVCPVGWPTGLPSPYRFDQILNIYIKQKDTLLKMYTKHVTSAWFYPTGCSTLTCATTLL